MSAQGASDRGFDRERDSVRERESVETKPSFKTTELIVWLLTVVGILIASLLVDDSFGADPAWRYVTYASVGYMISRGLSKAGSRQPRDS